MTNLADLAKKCIIQMSDIGNDIVDNIIEPIQKTDTDLKIRDFTKNRFLPKIVSDGNIRKITLFIPGCNTSDLEMRREGNLLDLLGCSPEHFENESSEFQSTVDWERVTFHYQLICNYNHDSVKAQLRHGLLKIYLELNETLDKTSNVVNID